MTFQSSGVSAFDPDELDEFAMCFLNSAQLGATWPMNVPLPLLQNDEFIPIDTVSDTDLGMDK